MQDHCLRGQESYLMEAVLATLQKLTRPPWRTP